MNAFEKIIENINWEKNEKLDNLANSIRRATDNISYVSDIDEEHLARIISDAQEAYGLENVNPSIYIRDSGIDIDFYVEEASYDTVIGFDDAALSYNGNWMHADIVKTIDDVNLMIHYEAKVPHEDKEILRACNKIVVVQETRTTVNC